MSLHKEIVLNQKLKSVKVASFGVVPIPSEWEKALAKVALAEVKVKQLGEVLSALEREFKGLVKEISERMPDIAISIVRRILGGLTLEVAQVEAIVTEVLKENAPEGEVLEVLLSERDYDLLEKEEDGLGKRYPGIKFERNGSLNSGDCLIKSRFGLVDATINTKLKQIRQELE